MNGLLHKFATLDLKGLFVAGLAMGALYFFVSYDNGSSILKDTQGLDDQINQEQAKVLETEKNVKKLQAEKENLKGMEDNLSSMQGAISQSLQMTDVIKWVDSKTIGSAVSLKGKEPKAIVRNDFLEELPIRLTLDGKFSDIVLYLFNLMNSKELLGKISSIVMSRSSTQGSAQALAQGVRVQADINVSAFRLVPASTVPPDGKKPEGKN